ncbi:MAG: MFS transporter [Clostridia bacterium]|nr:MFS transporter [Clostridia bacterium]
MSSLLIAIIYLAFISLGLPDSLLGSAWPEMHQQMSMPLSAAGIITMLVSLGTVLSSLLSDKITRKFHTGPVVTVSVALTMVGLFGFSFSTHFWMLCVIALPYGLGAGAIDAALNNYVALHYSSRHMSWLHSFWGVGTIISPYVMSYAITGGLGWDGGYRIIGIIQSCILLLLIITLPLWIKVERSNLKYTPKIETEPIGVRGALKIKGVPYVLIGFLSYCAVEATVMLWASSYFFEANSASEELSAALGSLFFIGITVGRFAAGFISNRIGDKNMIRAGIAISGCGIIIIALSFSSIPVSIIGFLLIGIGFAPIYPSIIHATPINFGEENSQSIIGIQMASAYVGSTFTPTLFGLIARYTDIRIMPVFLAIFVLITLLMTELLNKTVAKKQPL